MSSLLVSFLSALLILGTVSIWTCFGRSSVFGSFLFRLFIGDNYCCVFYLVIWFIVTACCEGPFLGLVGVTVDFCRSELTRMLLSFEPRREVN